MTQARISAWAHKIERKTKTPNLCKLPPTTPAFELNVMRAHYQCAIWKKALEAPPEVDPCEYGCMTDDETKTFTPLSLPSSTQPAPDYLLKRLCYSCASENPCRNKACGCSAARLACTIFCHVKQVQSVVMTKQRMRKSKFRNRML